VHSIHVVRIATNNEMLRTRNKAFGIYNLREISDHLILPRTNVCHVKEA